MAVTRTDVPVQEWPAHQQSHAQHNTSWVQRVTVTSITDEVAGSQEVCGPFRSTAKNDGVWVERVDRLGGGWYVGQGQESKLPASGLVWPKPSSKVGIGA